MSGSVVHLGDRSDHGGTMITSSGEFTVDEIEGCVSGDLHRCPIQGHGTTPVISNSENTGFDGRAILRNGDVAECGAVLIGTGSTTST